MRFRVNFLGGSIVFHKGLKKFSKASFKEDFKDVSRTFHRTLKGLARKFQGSLKD